MWNGLQNIRYGPIFYFEELARMQISAGIVTRKRYDYLSLFYVLGLTTMTCMKYIDEVFSDETYEIRFSWEIYYNNFNIYAKSILGVENFLSDGGDDEIYKKVFLREDFLS